MQKIYVLEEADLYRLGTLFRNKHDNEYVVLSTNKGYADIAQYSCKYQNVHLATVREDKLNESNRLGN